MNKLQEKLYKYVQYDIYLKVKENNSKPLSTTKIEEMIDKTVEDFASLQQLTEEEIDRVIKELECNNVVLIDKGVAIPDDE